MARIFIGVAWPYANGPFHIGHLAGAYLPADIFARFHRLRGNEVLMVSGSDMHGTPTLVTAEKEGTTAEVVANRNHAINRKAAEELGLSYDLFTTTHTPVHERTVQELFLRLLENGYVSRKTEENAYCPSHQRFLPDRYLTGECPYCHFPEARGDECTNCGRVLEPRMLIHPRCTLDGTAAEFRPSEHFYLLLDKLAPALERFLADKTYWRPNVIGVTKNFLDAGLHPTPITRDIDWGVPIPLEGYETKRFYVWFDAVTGYLSASKEWAIRSGRPEAWLRYWGPNEPVRQYYFLGKDNIFFHTLVWPGMLIGAEGYPLPYDVPANEWLQVEGRKLSKSRPEDLDAFVPTLLRHYRPDVIRFYAALLAPQNHDTQFEWDEFHQVSNEVLANQYGNLVQRLLVLTNDRDFGAVPTPPEDWSPDEPSGVGETIRATHEKVTKEFEAVRLKEALDLALASVRAENRRIHEAQPWKTADSVRRRYVYEGLWLLKAVAIWLAPVLPFSSAEIWRMLGFSEGPSAGHWDEALHPVPPGQTLGPVRPVFPREDRKTAPQESPPPQEPPSRLIPLGLRSARIQSVASHPQADRLYILRLDSGEPTPRTVVAGIQPFYSAKELEQRSVVLLTNLEPRTIRRITSQGMVLATDTGDRAELLTPPEDCPPGTWSDDLPEPLPDLRYDEFERSPLFVGRVVTSATEGMVRLNVGTHEATARGRADPGELVIVQLDSPGASTGHLVTMGGGHLLRPPPDSSPGTRIR
jgi:methionyl-tRNA synthetase